MATAQLDTLLRHIRKLAAGRGSSQRTDPQLLDDFSTCRDETAFAALVARHGPMVLRVCRRVLNHEQDAEDAFQATFLVLARKTGSIRKRAALAEWLHGVAYRTAMQAKRSAARRRNHEARLRAATPKAVASPTWDDVQAVLDQEIQRLPEAFRTAFVLCVLEGKSGPQAAAELGVKEGTVWSRLTRARQRLQQQLARRGIELSALLAALSVADGAGKAAVPAVLVNATLRSGLLVAAGGTAAEVIPSHIAALAAGVTRAMFLTKAKIATVVFLTVGVFAAGTGALTQQRLAGKQPPTIAVKRSGSPAPKEEARSPAPKDDDATDAVTFGGRVLDPDGKPFVGAQLYLLDYARKAGPRPGLAFKVQATSASEGRFRFKVAEADVTLPTGYVDDPWNHVFVVAMAEGYGFAFKPVGKRQAAADMTLQLAKDDVPIMGRVVDLQGKPVPGVTVRVRGLHKPTQGDLAAFVEGLKTRKEGYAVHNDLLVSLGDWDSGSLHPPLSTGADGRFMLKNIGRERMVTLRIDGPTIATKEINVMTRPGGTITVPEWKRNPEGGTLTYYGATFDHAAAPTKPIIGVVRDKDTGKPLAGAIVQSHKLAGSNVYERGHLQTVADQNGRYQLTGMPKGEGNIVRAAPPEGQRYLMSLKNVADSQGLDPVQVDFELKRGLWINGKVIDKVTGKPVSARIEYYVFDDNPHRQEAPGFTTDSYMDNHPKDGSFRLVGMPGRGMVVARAWGDQYVIGVGSDQIKEKDEYGFYHAYPHSCCALHYHRLVELNPATDAESVTCEVVLDPGRTLTGTVFDADGKPLDGARVSGLRSYGQGASYWEREPLKTAEFIVTGLQSGQRRQLILLHEGKRLAGLVVVQGNEKGPLRVTLQPWGTVMGRLVDADGQPRPNLDTLVLYGAGSAESFSTDQDGKFRIEGRVPGLKYSLSVTKGAMLTGRVFDDLMINSGETKDLGDVQIKSSE
jgi:RNA polymerase sigma factor (sigma-70 family)